ncbi:hypothetical protein AAE02nite_38100 [Adhaeribacter aerolatus]|uniref:Uncharacterized protein n=2 Tax=Adhaeribacter aerolatus TaxID=670289 RepID=A0A512B2F7_9BACT|nr:hypothetical protein AAE02nite_38100 [Adhaeribacter aerolatus]
MGMAVALLLVWIIADATNEPGVNDLPGNFEEVALYRNENNTGPIIRVYAVTLTDTLWTEMKDYGNFMPHTKYGNTKVYFFRKGSPVPDKLIPGAENFSPELKQYVLATYEKDAMGTVSFRKYPFL